MGCGLSQKCAFGLPPRPSPKEVKGEKKSHDCHNSCKKGVEGDPMQNLTFIIKTLILLQTESKSLIW